MGRCLKDRGNPEALFSGSQTILVCLGKEKSSQQFQHKPVDVAVWLQKCIAIQRSYSALVISLEKYSRKLIPRPCSQNPCGILPAISKMCWEGDAKCPGKAPSAAGRGGWLHAVGLTALSLHSCAGWLWLSEELLGPVGGRKRGTALCCAADRFCGALQHHSSVWIGTLSASSPIKPGR